MNAFDDVIMNSQLPYCVRLVYVQVRYLLNSVSEKVLQLAETIHTLKWPREVICYVVFLAL